MVQGLHFVGVLSITQMACQSSQAACSRLGVSKEFQATKAVANHNEIYVRRAESRCNLSGTDLANDRLVRLASAVSKHED
jgi:chorismate mutase